MIIFFKRLFLPLIAAMLFLLNHELAAQEKKIVIDWQSTQLVSKTTATLQVVMNPMLRRGSPIHEGSFTALKNIEAKFVRFVPWFPYPHDAVAELHPPTKEKTFWDFSHIDPVVEDFMKATGQWQPVMNFSTIPVWMFKTDKPVVFPKNPDEPFWGYNQGTELRDPSGKEVADYFARVFSWYTKGGFTDELGHYHKSGHAYKFAYWEVLNEPDLEHRMSPQLYTKIYDAVVTALKKISPETKFIGISVAHETNPEWFEYFLNPANHVPGTPLDGISYHFYARPAFSEQELDYYQYGFFDQANGFLDRVRYIEHIRKRLSPGTITQINEIGSILTNHDHKIPIPREYWNLAGALYAYIYLELNKLGIEAAGESQLVGYPTQFPDVSMMNWTNGKPNARYWVLYLLKNNFGPGDKLVKTQSTAPEVSAQAFDTPSGKKLLLINKRNQPVQLGLPPECNGATVSLVDVGTGENQPAVSKLTGAGIQLTPFEVCVVDIKK